MNILKEVLSLHFSFSAEHANQQNVYEGSNGIQPLQLSYSGMPINLSLRNKTNLSMFVF